MSSQKGWAGTPAPAARTSLIPPSPPLRGGRFLSPRPGRPSSVAAQGRATRKGWGADRDPPKMGRAAGPGAELWGVGG